MINEIKEAFKFLDKGKRILLTKGGEVYPTWAFKENNEYGVFIPYQDGSDVYASFSSMKVKSGMVPLDGTLKKVLMLTSNNLAYSNEFATIVLDFIELGKDNYNRLSILENPYVWIEKWKELVGNTKRNLTVYDVLGELKTLLYLQKNKKKPYWYAADKGTHDIETETSSYEVKSTINKTNLHITISSPHQLVTNSNKELYLSFCRFEKSEHGETINDLVRELEEMGFDKNTLSEHLIELGYHKGRKERKTKFKLLDMYIYKVDDYFPKLTTNQFVGNQLPKGVIHYTYTIDLSNLPYERIN